MMMVQRFQLGPNQAISIMMRMNQIRRRDNFKLLENFLFVWWASKLLDISIWSCQQY